MSAKLQEYGNGSFWFSLDEETVTLGVTNAAIQVLGNIQSIEFSEVGDEFSEGDWVAEIFGSEGSIEVLAPDNLTVEELNIELESEPSFLEDDPTGDGWLLRGKRGALA